MITRISEMVEALVDTAKKCEEIGIYRIDYVFDEYYETNTSSYYIRLLVDVIRYTMREYEDSGIEDNIVYGKWYFRKASDINKITLQLIIGLAGIKEYVEYRSECLQTMFAALVSRNDFESIRHYADYVCDSLKVKGINKKLCVILHRYIVCNWVAMHKIERTGVHVIKADFDDYFDK